VLANGYSAIKPQEVSLLQRYTSLVFSLSVHTRQCNLSVHSRVYPHNSIRQLLILRASEWVSECIMYVDWSSSFPKSRTLSPWQTFPLSNEFCNNVLHGLIRATNSGTLLCRYYIGLGKLDGWLFFLASYWSDSMECALILQKWVILHTIKIVLNSLKSMPYLYFCCKKTAKVS
jgi:hypothetical protein